MHIKDRGFLVTGAGSGLGAATARRLAAQGANVYLIDVNPAAASVAAELGENAKFAKADVTNAAEVQAVMADFAATHGELHGLVHCAGIAPAEKVIGREGPHSLESFARTVQINLVGAFNMVRLAADLMAKNEPTTGGERGVIVNTASVAAYDGQIGQAGYAASKGGVVAMTLPIARELARFGIRVCAIAPGIMETPMLTAMPADVQLALGKMVPFPSRLGQPDEFASLVLHIVENTYLNGEVIRLDGAIRMAPR
ncbi:NAD(P)-dependent dehydrogenase, short-chain alcohol dehydrogenase family [Collimonas sp. OK607]|uniref:3-hydroxyacyl-CoA dehydrogenase n=1 Tax=Collimonas sp. OK607 TaxID=1798194 RepID=UPI0008F0A6EB|nr:3-hydroxyacyl-CoA dehydrogenase [Collimonas sp. OK607]SFB04017.1 NAD(P)-dependent dehydrogenase, short-chain alcohol dehydrogenase family [Collimonas sp. OK607]